MAKFRVLYRESERGWGTNLFTGTEYEYLAEAQAAFSKCNADNAADYAKTRTVPDYYIQPEGIETFVEGKWIRYS